MAARHEILGGKVQVFMRPDSPYWHAAGSVNGRQFRRSTKTDSLAQAKDVAEDWFLDLKGKAKWGDGLPKKGVTFRKAADKFLDEFEVLTNGERSPAYVKLLRKKIKTHLDGFFGNKAVAEITESLVQDYRVHRAKHVDKAGNPKPPARTTVHHEIVALGHVLETAKRHGWIKFVPDLSPPFKGSGKVSHRAWFSHEEYKALYTKTRERAQDPRNPKWRWECEQFHDYVLFMANTGLRPDEAARLEFRDVKISLDDQPIKLATEEDLNLLLARCREKQLPEPILEIEVRGKRGVGFCKSMPGAVRPFLRLRSRLRATSQDRAVTTRDRRGASETRRAYGTTPRRDRGHGGISRGRGATMVKPGATDRIFGTTQRDLMNTVLEELDLKLDRDGQRRTAYSLRHTYICFRLMEGADIYQVAKNCRTSVEMIEKYYASHIKTFLDASAINVRSRKDKSSERIGEMTAEDE